MRQLETLYFGAATDAQYHAVDCRSTADGRPLLNGRMFDGLAMKPGVELLDDVSGLGQVVRRHVYYDVRLRMWLSRGEPVHWNRPWGLLDHARIEDDGATLFTTLRVDRECMFAGLFYGIDGMRVGGIRRLKVAPHLAYREKGIDGVIPPNALLTVEVQILAEG